MSDKADAMELVKDRTFQSMMDRMDADADAAERLCKTQLSDTGFANFPAEFLNDYKSDGNAEIKARGNFNLECASVAVGRGSAKKLMAAYDNYSGNLEALKESNARMKALIDANNIAMVTSVFLAMKMLIVSALQRLDRLDNKLKELLAELDKADGEVIQVECKRALNLGVSAFTLLVAPEAHLAKLLIPLGAVTVHIIIDEALGSGTAKGKAIFVAGDGVEYIHAMTEAEKKVAGATGAILTLKLDSDEVAEAREILKSVQEKVLSTKKAYDDTMAFLKPLVPKLQAFDVATKAFFAEIGKALNRSYDAGKGYDAIRNAIKKTL